MKNLQARITALTTRVRDALSLCTTLNELEQVRIVFLSRKGEVSSLMGCLKDLSMDEKKECGPLLNALKQNTENLFEETRTKIVEQTFKTAEETEKHYDISAYLPQQPRGSLHVYTQAMNDIQTLFASMGYVVMDGPEVETDYHNFEALNIPKNHPARDMQDTFWIDVPGLVMRTHTSNVQVRTMEKQNPPFAIIAQGRTFRNEATDASHDCMFRQLEGLALYEDASVAHLIATMKLFLQTFFNKKTVSIRCRPSYFPFVEPAIEIDVSCPFCSHGCSTCKHSTWIEVVGSGLVHPNVLKAGNIDTKKYAGFAFGFGFTRLVMIKYGINDVRLLHNPTVEFLKQF